MNEPVEDLLLEFTTQEQLSALERYFEILVQWNKTMNLTGIVEREEVFIKHFWDSLSVLQLPIWQRGGTTATRVIDVGTGAGLPGLPLAICKPDMQVTLCDSLRKRTDFLEHVVRELGLQNVEVYHARSEEFAHLPAHRNQYNVVVARAVAKLNVLVELLVPFCRTGGYVVCYKGPDVEEELQAAGSALKQLGAQLEEVRSMELPLGYGGRTIVAFKVLRESPKRFPRKPGTPQRQPL